MSSTIEKKNWLSKLNNKFVVLKLSRKIKWKIVDKIEQQIEKFWKNTVVGVGGGLKVYFKLCNKTCKNFQCFSFCWDKILFCFIVSPCVDKKLCKQEQIFFYVLLKCVFWLNLSISTSSQIFFIEINLKNTEARWYNG